MIFVKNSRDKGREGGQHDQHYIKNKFVKNRVGGIKLDKVFKYTGGLRVPLNNSLFSFGPSVTRSFPVLSVPSIFTLFSFMHHSFPGAAGRKLSGMPKNTTSQSFTIPIVSFDGRRFSKTIYAGR